MRQVKAGVVEEDEEEEEASEVDVEEEAMVVVVAMEVVVMEDKGAMVVVVVMVEEEAAMVEVEGQVVGMEIMVDLAATNAHSILNVSIILTSGPCQVTAISFLFPK